MRLMQEEDYGAGKLLIERKTWAIRNAGTLLRGFFPRAISIYTGTEYSVQIGGSGLFKYEIGTSGVDLGENRARLTIVLIPT